MSTKTLTKDTFESAVEENDIVFIDFWASWCGPCKAFAPVYEAASEQHPAIIFGKVDTEDQPELAQAFRVRAIPTLMAFRERIMVFEQAGALPASVLQSLIEQVKGLDMDEVRQKVAEQTGDSKADN